ncbi:MAG: T9SS type A sorting domain-containing protein [candidate division WOR-3 bacterium]
MIRFSKLIFACYLLSTAYYLLLFAYPPGWSDDILLTPEDMKERMYPDIDVDSFNNVWVAWDSGTWACGTAEALYSKRDSLGSCLIPETDVSNNPTYSLNPVIAVDGSNNIQFVWYDQTPQGLGLWHAKLANDGSVIIPPHLAVNGNNALFPLDKIALNKYQEINVIWDEGVGYYNYINYTKLDSLGNPIIPKIRVSPESVVAFWPGIGVDSFANNHLGYRTNRTSTDSLAYTKLDKDGNALIDYKILDAGLSPTIIADRSQNIHIVYPHEQTPYGPWVINYLKLDQQGNIIIFPKALSPTQHESMSPHMAMDSLQYLHVVWQFDNRVDTNGIMYAKLDTMGNFVIPPMPVVYPPYSPGGGLARIAVDRNNRLHLVWVDGRIDPPNTADIFYKRGENEQTVKELARLRAQQEFQISVYPNPFTREIKITFSHFQKTEKAKIEIFDILGRRVKEFSHLTIQPLRRQNYGVLATFNQVVWYGNDDLGRRLPAGVYVIYFRTNNFVLTKKVIKID